MNLRARGGGANAVKSLAKRPFMIKNADAMRIISNFHALGGTNLISTNRGGGGGGGGEMLYTEQGHAISYDTLKDLTTAFQLIQKNSKRGEIGGDMITVEALIRTLGKEAERMSQSELARLVREADPEETGMVNFKHYCNTIIQCRIPYMPKGSEFNKDDDHVAKMKRERVARERGARRRDKELKLMSGR